MRVPAHLTGLAAAALLGACSFHVNWHSECTLEAPLAQSFDLEGIHSVSLIGRSGLIEIRGSTDATELSFDGTARSSELGVLGGIRLDYEREGGVLMLEAFLPDTYNECAALDIRLELPPQLALIITDDSGSITLDNVGPTIITDDSGSITARGVGGDLTITDGSGSISVEDVAGDVLITDGSGSIEVAGTTGSVRFTDDSGSVTLSDIAGSVHVASDGSGSMTFLRVGGSVIVNADGSGSITAIDVTGDFRVLADGSGSVTHERIGGRVELAD